jgi:Heterokaryon incompatibility protein (HET)
MSVDPVSVPPSSKEQAELPLPPPTFEYKSLTTETRQIRLLILAPGVWSSEIKCDLKYADLDQEPYYEALSYTWGDANDVRPILLAGSVFNVTTNLEIALRYIRFGSTHRTLWIDALCINQRDIPERNYQVAMMRDIFLRAAKVLAWTGPPSENVQIALEGIEYVAKRVHDNREILFGVKRPRRFTPKIISDLGFDLKVLDWNAIWDFLERPYWSRMWIVQELACSGPTHNDRCIILCGQWELTKDQLDDFSKFWCIVYDALSDFTGRQVAHLIGGLQYSKQYIMLAILVSELHVESSSSIPHFPS